MTNLNVRPPIWYWIVSVIALIWNGLGVDGYLGQVYNTERYQSSFTSEELEIAANLPSWIMRAFAVAVFTGVLGSLALLLRKKWAKTLFIVSLLAVITQMSYTLIKGYANHLEMTISITVFAIFLVWFSRKSNSKGWIT